MKGIVVSSAGSALVATVMAGSPASNSFRAIVYPVQSRTITSMYGERVDPITGEERFHAGVDIAAPRGSEIRVVSDGIVAFSGKLGGYGLLISVRHKGGITTHYGHCESSFVQVGERVRAGQMIGLVGSTGRAAGPHLHLETRVLGAPLDPRSIFTGLRPVKE